MTLQYTVQNLFRLCHECVAARSALRVQRGGGNLPVPGELVNGLGGAPVF